MLRLNGATDLEAIHIIKKPGGTLEVGHRCRFAADLPRGFGLHEIAPIRVKYTYIYIYIYRCLLLKT